MQMKRTNSTCIFLYLFFCFLSLMLLGVSFVTEKSTPVPKDTVVQAKNEEESVESTAVTGQKYIVIAEEDTVVVYELVDWKKYLTTDIAVSRLPENIQEDLKDGICFTNEKELFSFLENYSS